VLVLFHKIIGAAETYRSAQPIPERERRLIKRV
jgi:hypothetical protein